MVTFFPAGGQPTWIGQGPHILAVFIEHLRDLIRL